MDDGAVRKNDKIGRAVIKHFAAVAILSADPPPISWSTLMMRKTEDQKWESSDTNRKRSSR
ncbi:hypothetical protein BOW37_12620, partial [Solemya velum gill symbiont]